MLEKIRPLLGSGHDLVARESLRGNQLSREDAQENSEATRPGNA